MVQFRNVADGARGVQAAWGKITSGCRISIALWSMKSRNCSAVNISPRQMGTGFGAHLGRRVGVDDGRGVLQPRQLQRHGSWAGRIASAAL